MYIDLISFIYYRLFTLPFPCRPKASRYAGHGKEKGRGEGESEGETLEAPFLPPGGRLSLASHVSPHSASVPLPVRPA